MNNLKISIIILLGAILSTGCNNSNDASEQNISDSNNAAVAASSATNEPFTADEAAVFKFDMVLANLPSPMEILNDLNKSKLPFDPSVMLDEKKYHSATTTQQKALFIGAYGINLGYTINYDQTQLSINYLASIKKLSDDLGISRYFDNSFMERFNRNLEHKDSLINMTNDVFSLTDKYLRNNEQLKSSVLIITGSWIESIYIASTLVKDADRSESNAAVYTRLFNQRLCLKQLLNAMEPFKNDEYFKKIIPALNEVLSVSLQPASEAEFSREQAQAMADMTQKLHSELF